VDHHRDPARVQPESRGGRRVVQAVDHLDLQEVVAGPQAADLAQPAVAGSLADLAGVGVGDDAGVLAVLQVAGHAKAPIDRIPGAARQHVVQLGRAAQPPHRPPAQPTRDPGVQRVHERLQPTGQVGLIQVGQQQPHPAGDVEADPTR